MHHLPPGVDPRVGASCPVAAYPHAHKGLQRRLKDPLNRGTIRLGLEAGEGGAEVGDLCVVPRHSQIQRSNNVRAPTIPKETRNPSVSPCPQRSGFMRVRPTPPR